MKNILEIKGLKKYFKVERMFSETKQTVRAVDDVSFALDAGEILAIVGESGSGKTTVARCVAGLETPDAGEMLFEGKPLGYKNPETRRRVQYIFQDTFGSLNPRMRILEILKEPLAFHFGLRGAELEQSAGECLEKTGLTAALLDKYPHELSGGQRQRVVIARALAMKPGVLIADEPVSSLDVSVQAQILKLFTGLNKKGISMIFITHDLRIVKNLADNIMVMQNGKVVEEGVVDRVYGKPASDYTKQLLASIPNSPYK